MHNSMSIADTCGSPPRVVPGFLIDQYEESEMVHQVGLLHHAKSHLETKILHQVKSNPEELLYKL